MLNYSFILFAIMLYRQTNVTSQISYFLLSLR